MIFYLTEEENGRKVLCKTQAEAKSINPDFIQLDIPTDKDGMRDAYQELLDIAHSASLDSKVEPEPEAQKINPEPFSSTPGATNPRDPEGSNPQPDLIVNSWFERCSIPVQLHWAQHALDQAMKQWPKGNRND